MDCKIISTEPVARRRRRAGFTLVEMLVSFGIGGVVLTALGSLSYFTSRSYVSIYNYVDLDQHSRHALDRMTSEIRQADGVKTYTTNSMSFDYSGNTLSYIYSPSTRQVVRLLGTEREVLLEECDSIDFRMFQRNPVAGAYDYFPAGTNVVDCKLVQVSWTCSRQINGQKANTESVQSAKIVLRKQ